MNTGCANPAGEAAALSIKQQPFCSSKNNIQAFIFGKGRNIRMNRIICWEWELTHEAIGAGQGL